MSLNEFMKPPPDDAGRRRAEHEVADARRLNRTAHLARSAELARWRWAPIAVALALAGATYTVLSEWMNMALENWSYSELMPVLRVFGAEIGLSPLAQWLLLPPLALWFALPAIKGERT